jgi:hypothetical protein
MYIVTEIPALTPSSLQLQFQDIEVNDNIDFREALFNLRPSILKTVIDGDYISLDINIYVENHYQAHTFVLFSSSLYLLVTPFEYCLAHTTQHCQEET